MPGGPTAFVLKPARRVAEMVEETRARHCESRLLGFAGRMGNALVNVAVAAMLLFVMAATVPALVGFHPVTVYGGSMGDALPVGSVAIMQPVAASKITRGDIIAVSRGAGLPVIHRVVDIEEGAAGRLVTLKGDANATNDVNQVTVSGYGDRLVYYVPWAGYLLAWAASPWGLATLLGLPALYWTLRQVVGFRNWHAPRHA